MVILKGRGGGGGGGVVVSLACCHSLWPLICLLPSCKLIPISDWTIKLSTVCMCVHVRVDLTIYPYTVEEASIKSTG